MRVSVLLLVGVSVLSVFASVPAALAQVPDKGLEAAQQRQERDRRRLYQRQQLDARDQEAFKRRQQVDNERVDRARQVMQEKYRQWQQMGDRRSYRELRNAYQDWIDEQRDREDAASRFTRRWQREHPGSPYPLIPGMTAPTLPGGYAMPGHGRSGMPPPPGSPGSGLGGEVPAAGPSAPIPAPPQPQPATGPSLPEPADGPMLAEPIPTPPSTPLPPSVPASGQEL